VDISAGTPPVGQAFKNWTSTPAVAFDNANSASTFFTMLASAVTVTAIYEAARYTATLTVTKDGAAWNAHGKAFTLRRSDNETVVEAMTGADATVTANVLNGTWKVYEGDTDTGATIAINNAAGNATLTYYTVTFSVNDAGTASGSSISATCGGNDIASGTTVLSGKELVVTATGAGASVYTYLWSGTASGTDHTYTTIVSAAVNAVCRVTGNRLTTADNPLQANLLKAWTNNGILHVSGIAEGKQWKLYNVSGALVKHGIAGSDLVTISIELPGMYIIQSEGNTLKVMFN